MFEPNTRRERERREHIQHILDAAESMFAEQGFFRTTMPAMKNTIKALKCNVNDVKVIVGGAPVTQDYADKIGADGYAPDAASAVDLAKSLVA